MQDEGYIKYQLDWQVGPAPQAPHLQALLECRTRLHTQSLIGHYPELGVGFGNISIRAQAPGQFIVSGTQTGHIPTLSPAHCTLVTATDLDQNWLRCLGPVKASSESLTHAAVYAADTAIGAVIHVHHLEHWRRLIHRVPTTLLDVAYGTPEMAREVLRLFTETSVAQSGFFAMGGHEEGLIAFGPTVEAAEKALHRALTSS